MAGESPSHKTEFSPEPASQGTGREQESAPREEEILFSREELREYRRLFDAKAELRDKLDAARTPEEKISILEELKIANEKLLSFKEDLVIHEGLIFEGRRCQEERAGWKKIFGVEIGVDTLPERVRTKEVRERAKALGMELYWEPNLMRLPDLQNVPAVDVWRNIPYVYPAIKDFDALSEEEKKILRSPDGFQKSF